MDWFKAAIEDRSRFRWRRFVACATAALLFGVPTYVTMRAVPGVSPTVVALGVAGTAVFLWVLFCGLEWAGLKQPTPVADAHDFLRRSLRLLFLTVITIIGTIAVIILGMWLLSNR